jgi:hypothetical protein
MSTGSIGQTHIRMVQPAGTPRIGQTTIRPTTPQIIRTTTNQIRPMTTIRGQTTIMQTNNQVPALHPVSGATIISGGAQVNSPLSTPKVELCFFFAFLTFFITTQSNQAFASFPFCMPKKR